MIQIVVRPNLIARAAALAAIMVFGACGTARESTAYRDATRELVMAKNADIKSCYDAELTREPNLSGQVVVNFQVQSETGKIVDARIDPDNTTAPASLSGCVLRAMDGLALNPADRNQGLATFRWDFQPGST